MKSEEHRGAIHPAGDPSPEAASASTTFSHANFDGVLRRFVDDRGLVDYSRLARDRGDLDLYFASIAAASPDSHPALFPDDDARLASGSTPTTPP